MGMCRADQDSASSVVRDGRNAAGHCSTSRDLQRILASSRVLSCVNLFVSSRTLAVRLFHSCGSAKYNDATVGAVFQFRYIFGMNAVDRAIEILRTTEDALRGLVSDATAACDYESVVQVAQWAKTISELKPRAKPSSAGNQAEKSEQKRRVVPRSTTKKDNYPRFYRQGDSVIRIALSKKGEYQHKAPYNVLIALADAMAKSGSDGRIFSTDDFLPIEVDDAEVPAYQAYLGISLIKQAGLIDQHGRQGYSIPHLASFKDAVVAAWKKLPRHSKRGS